MTDTNLARCKLAAIHAAGDTWISHENSKSRGYLILNPGRTFSLTSDELRQQPLC